MRKNLLYIIALSIITVLTGTDSAWAQAQTLGDMTAETYTALLPLQALLAAISYILGLFFGISAIRLMRGFTESPGDVPPLKIGLRVLAAAFFISAPFAANVIVNTISASDVGSANNVTITNADQAPNQVANQDGLDGVLQRIVQDMWFPLMDMAIPLFCYLAGIVLLLVGLKRMALAANDGAAAPGSLGTLTTFFAAAALMSVGYMMNLAQGSLFGTDSLFTNVVFKNSTGGVFEDRATNALWAVFVFLRIVGYISFIRGLFMLRGAAEGAQNASLMGASTHIIAGAILANAGAFVDVIQGTIFDNQADYIFTVA